MACTLSHSAINIASCRPAFRHFIWPMCSNLNSSHERYSTWGSQRKSRHSRAPYASSAAEFTAVATTLVAPLQALMGVAGVAILGNWWWDTRPRGWAATELVQVCVVLFLSTRLALEARRDCRHQDNLLGVVGCRDYGFYY